VVVTDAAKRAAIGEIYRQCYEIYKGLDGVYVGSIQKSTDTEQAQQQRVQTSADFLGEHMGDAPALVIACNAGGRVDGAPAAMSASMLGNILPAMWSFMLAARARGLGTAWTSLHLVTSNCPSRSARSGRNRRTERRQGSRRSWTRLLVSHRLPPRCTTWA
jgi:nitroreductase